MLAASMDTYLQQLYPELNPDILAAVMQILAVMLQAALVFSLVLYVLYSFGLYCIAKRRGIYRPWLAWLPLCRDWTLGGVADRYQLTVKYHFTINAPALVILKLITYVFGVGTVVISQELLTNVENLLSWSGKKVSQYQYEREILPLQKNIESMTLILNIICVLTVIAALLYLIFYYRAHYDLFASCRPEQKVVFLVLSILFPVTLPFFVFACRNKDDGMPPRKVEEQPQSVVQQPVIEPVFAPVVETAVPQEPVIFSDEETQQ